MVKLRYTPDEIARMGDSLYDSVVAPRVVAEDAGHFVAIDVESGAYEIAPDELSAMDRLRARKPDAQLWLQRVGVSYTHHFGPRTRHPEATRG
jgi:formylmethanofuran dehydrogenase subunit B